ncbi:efflux RND transporter permease subunit [Terriglobus albidus]|uniref:Efflux RND transporter permease subunit n=1 Tax=Terriglobus albidus TaxID=1592106 RepID=A0A5B9EGW8_9BACT|nr:efflux RND transporter permease subunit [Terriglobus albidus]QEE30385.1 efflux RND transporter permease subunit [Terriglobus albidus]
MSVLAEKVQANTEKPFWLERYRSSIFFFLIVLSLAGIYASQKVPISVFPETNFPRVVIGVDNGVMPVEQMQVTITKPIEDAMNSVPGLATVRSNTSRGSAEVSLFFDWNMDMFRTLQLVDAALSKVRQTLPATAVITTNRLTFATFPIIGYSLTSDTLSQTELWELATYTLKPPLNRVSGVSMVTVQGGKVPEFHIVPNMARLQATNVTILDIVNAVQASNIVDSPGLYEENHQLILGLVGAQAHDADQLGHLVVKATASGTAVRVSDVATVQPGVLPVYTTVTADNHAAVLLNITRQPSSNTVAVADAVAAQVEQLKRNLPAGVQMKLYYDQAELVRESIRSVRDAIMIGLLLACVILFLFLGDWSSSLVAGLVIPVTVAITVLVLWTIGQSFNLMTLGGLAAAIGLVIDDAIVVVENIVLHRDTGESRASAARLALKEISAPLVGSTITPVVVFLPLVSVTGVTGSFFRALAITMTVALLTSLLLAVTWTPALSLALLRDRKNGEEGERHEEHHGKLMTRVIATHHRVLAWSLARPVMLLGICGLLVAGTYAGYRVLGSDLLPEMDEGGFILDYIMPAGSSLTETNRVLEHVNRILHSMPEVESTSRRTGLQMGLAAVTEANTGDMTVRLKKDRDRGIDEVIADARAQIKKAEPELDVEFIQVLQDMINDLSNAPEPIQIKLFCDNFAVLNDVAPRVGDAISKIPGVVSVENGIENTISGSGTNFQVDPVVAARMGFTPQEVAEDATSILDGVNPTDPLIANGRPYTIRVRLGDETRKSLDAMQNTVFNSATGKLATLGSLAQVTQLPPQNQIRRENLQRLVTVTAQLQGTDLGSAIARVQQTVDAMHLPSSVRIEYGGTYQEQQQSFHQLLQVLLLSLALVFGVLLMEFRNLYAPTAILTSSVLSISGVVLALLVTRTTFNVASFMGLIMVIGIVAKNGILLLDADERYRREGGSPYDAMLHAAQRRLRPILMTATAAICGMLPLAFALGSGSQMLQPLAISVIGGLVVSMLLSLIVTPVVYYLLTAHRHDEAKQV